MINYSSNLGYGSAGAATVSLITNQQSSPSSRLNYLEKKMEKNGKRELKFRQNIQKLLLKQNKVTL